MDFRHAIDGAARQEHDRLQGLTDIYGEPLYSIEPCDMLAEPLTDLPAAFTFSLPGRKGDGLVARLEYWYDGTFNYRIEGITARAGERLRQYGCWYSPCVYSWYCRGSDYDKLEPLVERLCPVA